MRKPKGLPRGGAPITTIKDVAARAGLSIATVSKYINGGNVLPENRSRLERAIRRLGYRRNEFARGLKTDRSMSIGVLIPKLAAFSTAIVSRLESFVRSRGYTTMVSDYRDDGRLLEQGIEFLMDKRVDGIVLSPHAAMSSSWRLPARRRFPVVTFDSPATVFEADSVLVDNREASALAVRHLLERGHTRIAVIVGPGDAYTSVERLAGYRLALKAAGVPDAGMVFCGHYTMTGGYRAMLEALDARASPTAVYVTNYHMTLGAIMALNERGVRVPRDLSIVGFDSMELTQVVKPRLTTIEQPIERIAEETASMLVRRMAGDWSGFPQTVRLQAELQVRESVALRRNREPR